MLSNPQTNSMQLECSLHSLPPPICPRCGSQSVKDCYGVSVGGWAWGCFDCFLTWPLIGRAPLADLPGDGYERDHTAEYLEEMAEAWLEFETSVV